MLTTSSYVSERKDRDLKGHLATAELCNDGLHKHLSLYSLLTPVMSGEEDRDEVACVSNLTTLSPQDQGLGANISMLLEQAACIRERIKLSMSKYTCPLPCSCGEFSFYGQEEEYSNWINFLDSVVLAQSGVGCCNRFSVLSPINEEDEDKLNETESQLLYAFQMPSPPEVPEKKDRDASCCKLYSTTTPFIDYQVDANACNVLGELTYTEDGFNLLKSRYPKPFPCCNGIQESVKGTKYLNSFYSFAHEQETLGFQNRLIVLSPIEEEDEDQSNEKEKRDLQTF